MRNYKIVWLGLSEMSISLIMDIDFFLSLDKRVGVHGTGNHFFIPVDAKLGGL